MPDESLCPLVTIRMNKKIHISEGGGPRANAVRCLLSITASGDWRFVADETNRSIVALRKAFVCDESRDLGAGSS